MRVLYHCILGQRWGADSVESADLVSKFPTSTQLAIGACIPSELDTSTLHRSAAYIMSTSIVVTGQALAPTHTVGERLPVSPRLLCPLVSALHVPKCTYNISHIQWMEKSYCFGMYVAAATATPSPNLIVRSAAPSGVRHAIFELPGLSSCH